MSVGSLVLVGVLLWLAEPDQHESAQKPPEKAMTQVDKPLLVEREGERLVWRLQAETAKQQAGGNMDMDTPHLELFTRAGLEVPIHSKKAFFDASSRSIRFEGDVVVVYRDWELHSQTLIYDLNHDVIRLPGAFRLDAPGVIARGRNMMVYRQEQRLLVTEGVWIRDEREAVWSPVP